MGFDLFIQMSLTMDDATGKPYYYGKGIEKIYELPDIEIPKELQQYLYGRGHHFHVYTDKFNRKNIYNVDVDTFLDKFPSWERYKESEYYNPEYPDDWSYEDHKKFRKLLQFLQDQPVTFTVSWSY